MDDMKETCKEGVSSVSALELRLYDFCEKNPLCGGESDSARSQAASPHGCGLISDNRMPSGAFYSLQGLVFSVVFVSR